MVRGYLYGNGSNGAEADVLKSSPCIEELAIVAAID